MFNTSKATTTINNEEFSSNYIPVGINSNIFLKEVNCRKSTNGRDFLEIIFEDTNGKTASMSEWKNEKSTFIKTDKDLQNADNRQFGRIMQILNCYYPTIADTTLNTFVEMINWVKAQLDPMIAVKKPLTLKVVYDKNGYTTISKNGIFVEAMGTEPSQIKLFKRDLLERPVKADVESTDPLAAKPGIPENIEKPHADVSSDLPF